MRLLQGVPRAAVPALHDADVSAHVGGHLRDDVVVEGRVPVVFHEAGDVDERLGVRLDVPRALDHAAELAQPAVVRQPVLVLLLDLDLVAAEARADVLVSLPLLEGGVALPSAAQEEGLAREVLGPELVGRQLVLVQHVDLAVPQGLEFARADGHEVAFRAARGCHELGAIRAQGVRDAALRVTRGAQLLPLAATGAGCCQHEKREAKCAQRHGGVLTRLAYACASESEVGLDLEYNAYSYYVGALVKDGVRQPTAFI